jgi:hypothetical protein
MLLRPDHFCVIIALQMNLIRLFLVVSCCFFELPLGALAPIQIAPRDCPSSINSCLGTQLNHRLDVQNAVPTFGLQLQGLGRSTRSATGKRRRTDCGRSCAGPCLPKSGFALAFSWFLGWRVWNRWQTTATMNLLVRGTLGRRRVVSYNYLSSGFQNGFIRLVGWSILRLFARWLTFVLHGTPPPYIVAPPLRVGDGLTKVESSSTGT